MKYPLYIVSINKAGSSRIRQINGVMVIVLTSSSSNQSSAKYYKTGYLFWVCTIKENIKLVISAEYVPLKRT